MEKGQTYRHQSGAFYEVADVTASTVSFFPCGGGLQRKATTEIFERDFEEAEIPSELKCGPVTLDGMDEPVMGWYNPHRRWNGWLIPYVALDDCLKVLEVDAADLVEEEGGYSVEGAEFEAVLSRCSAEGMENFYYIDGFCWEEGE